MKKPDQTQKYLVLTVGILLLMLVLYALFLISRPVPVELQGEVEATQIRIASKLTGRLDSICVKKGDPVRGGKLLFTIKSPELEAKYAQASAVQQAAGAQRDKANNGAQREDVQAAFNSWQMALAASELATKSFGRINALFLDGVVPEQQKDEVETKMKAARETEKAAFSLYEKARKGARYEDKDAAAAMVLQADGVLSEVNAYLTERRIFAPISGEVANVMAESGELVTAGFPVVTIVDLSDIKVIFNIREDLLPTIKKGTILPAMIPALGKTLIPLKVTSIGVLGDYAVWNATKTKGDFDLKTFEIQAVPINPVEGLRPGMSAIVDMDNVSGDH